MRSRFKKKKEVKEFEQKILDVARVARVMEGGRRFSFRVTVAIGDRKGRVGVGVSKAKNVADAIEKAISDAKKNMIEFPIENRTIPHEISSKFGGARIILIPAVEGRGIVAGGAVRTILDLVGIKDVSSKIKGSKNKINNARAAIEALKILKESTCASTKATAGKEDDKVEEIKDTKEIVRDKEAMAGEGDKV